MIEAVCGCGKRVSVGDEHAGRRMKCPACAATIAIPQAGPAPPALPQTAGVEDASIVRLRRKCAWLQATAVVSLALSCLAILRRPEAPAKVGGSVEAGRFVLRDATGRPRAFLEINAGGQPHLRFVGNQKGAVDLGFVEAQDDFPFLQFVDIEGRKRVELLAERDGANLQINDRKGEPAARLSQFEDAGGALSLDRRGSSAHFEAQIFSNGRIWVDVSDESGKSVLRIPVKAAAR